MDALKRAVLVGLLALTAHPGAAEGCKAAATVQDALAHGLSGRIDQPGFPSYDILIWSDPSRINVRYPALSCGGVFQAMNRPDAAQSTFREHITFGLQTCVDLGYVTLSKVETGWFYEWQETRGGPVFAFGMLTCEGAKTPKPPLS